MAGADAGQVREHGGGTPNVPIDESAANVRAWRAIGLGPSDTDLISQICVAQRRTNRNPCPISTTRDYSTRHILPALAICTDAKFVSCTLPNYECAQFT